MEEGQSDPSFFLPMWERSDGSHAKRELDKCRKWVIVRRDVPTLGGPRRKGDIHRWVADVCASGAQWTVCKCPRVQVCIGLRNGGFPHASNRKGRGRMMARRASSTMGVRRMHFSLPPRSVERLDELARRTEASSQTEVIKEALLTYEALVSRLEEGKKFFMKEDDGSIVPVIFNIDVGKTQIEDQETLRMAETSYDN